MKPTLLITGANGFLGSWLIEQARDRWHTQGTYRSHPLTTPNIDWVQADFQAEADITDLLDRTQPDAIIHLAAQSNTTRCEQDPHASHFINAIVPGLLAQACAHRNLPYLFTSSGIIFDGKTGNYRESDPVGPLNHYARQKVAAEQDVLQCYPDAIVARMPLMFSFDSPQSIEPDPDSSSTATAKSAPRSAMANLEIALRDGKPVRLFTDEIRTPVSAAVAATGLLQALDWAIAGRHRGLLHLGGRTAISRYELGCLVAQVRGYSTDSITACRQRDVSLSAPRPQNVSLNSDLAFSLGYVPPALEQQLA